MSRARWCAAVAVLAACGDPNRDFLKGTSPDLVDAGTAAGGGTGGPMCSAPTATASKLQIVNVTTTALRIYYVDASCSQLLTEMTTVSGGATLPTVVGDVWLVKDAISGAFLRQINIVKPVLQVEVFQ